MLLKKAALKGETISRLIYDYYLGEKIGLINKIKGIGYIVMSNWAPITAILSFIAVIVGLIFVIGMFQ